MTLTFYVVTHSVYTEEGRTSNIRSSFVSIVCLFKMFVSELILTLFITPLRFTNLSHVRLPD